MKLKFMIVNSSIISFQQINSCASLLGFVLEKSSITKLINRQNCTENFFVICQFDGSFQKQEALKFLSQYSPHKVILVSYNPVISDESLYLRAGARGYIDLSGPASSILNSLSQILNGELAFNKLTLSEVIMDGLPKMETKVENLDVSRMTNKELQVLDLIREGLQNKEIATELHIAPATVKTHVQRILKEVGVRNRGQVIAKTLNIIN